MIHILCDPRRDNPDLPREMERQQIEQYCIWFPVMGCTSVAQSINRSHKQIVAYLKAKAQPYGVIFEEDVMFPSERGWRFYKDERTDNAAGCDLYLGGAYACALPPDVPLDTGQWRGLHCYTIYAKFYDTFLGLPDDDHIDGLVSQVATAKLCYPMAALQRPGMSANGRGFVDYNVTLRAGDVYQ